MAEYIPLKDLPGDNDEDGDDDNEDWDWDDTTFQPTNTSTNPIEYPGYGEDEVRRREEWDIPSERN